MFGDVVGLDSANLKLVLVLRIHVPAFALVDVVVFDISHLLLDILEGDVAFDIDLGKMAGHDVELDLKNVAVEIQAYHIDIVFLDGDLEDSIQVLH